MDQLIILRRVPPLLRRAPWWSVALVCVLWIWAPPATGYVLKGPHILDLMVKKLAGAKTLVVDQKVLVEDPAVSLVPIELDESLRFILPGLVRSDIHYKETHRIHVQAHGSHLTIVDEAIVGERAGRFDRYKELLLYKSRHALHKALSIHGVDVGISSLGRIDNRIVYVIGAHYPDDAASQLWVDKERLIPLRWININPPGDSSSEPERLEFVYRNWQNADGVWYPMEIETFHNQQLIRRIRVTRVQANAVIDGELLNIAHLKTVYKEKETVPPGDVIPSAEENSDTGTDADVDEVQRTLEDFRKKFEP